MSAPARKPQIETAPGFPERITPAMRALITAPDDPVGRQFVADPRESHILASELADPIADGPHSPVKGIVHRYPDRVLFKLTATCTVHCRFCFRKEMIGPLSEDNLTADERAAALDYIRQNKGIWEVVISGGDPLALSPRRLAEVMAALDAIEHVEVVRFHSRVPAVSPERVTDEFIAALTATQKTVYIAIHTNAAEEHGAEMRAACDRLRRAGLVLLGQTVLLRGVNDTHDTLAALMRSCVRLGIKPYYLHLLDRAKGTSHFKVPLDEAVSLVSGLRGHLSGLCQPQLMLDLPGGFGKVPVPVSDVVARGGGRYDVTDFNGQTHLYRDEI